MPRRPETHAKPDMVHEAWDSFDHDAMIEELVQSVEYVDFDQCPSYKPPRQLRARHRELAPAQFERRGDKDATGEKDAVTE